MTGLRAKVSRSQITACTGQLRGVLLNRELRLANDTKRERGEKGWKIYEDTPSVISSFLLRAGFTLALRTPARFSIPPPPSTNVFRFIRVPSMEGSILEMVYYC